jgi:predicted HicB family RNase H-like nuclease
MAKKQSRPNPDFKTTFRITPELHRTIKIFCAEEGISMKAVFEKSVVEFMARSRKGRKVQ